MSIKRNILANYVGQFYVTLIGIIMVPMYVKYMGAEAYGLVGFYAMLQAWFMLLDMGLTPAMSRETARFQGGAIDALHLRRLLRSLEGVFIAVAVVGAVLLITGSSFIANNWLKVQRLPLDEVQNAVMLIAVITALRWMCGLYRGVITGLERLVWLNSMNIVMATGRFVLVIPLFIYVGTSPTLFFSYQLLVAIVELLALVAQAYLLLPKVSAGQRTSWEWGPLREVFKFSLSISVAVMLYLVGSQADKLLLSNLLTLTDYAYFTLAALLGGGVQILGAPISTALVPRMTKLNAEANEAGLIRVYRNATQLVCVMVIPAMLVLAFFAEQVLWVWTGNIEIVSKAKSILTPYALANGIQVLGALPLCIQLAKGDLKLHMVGSGLYTVLIIPAVIWGTLHFGASGAGYAFLGVNVLFFAFWVPKLHGRLVTGLHTQWLLHDVMGIFIFSTAAAIIMNEFIIWPTTRLNVAVAVIMAGGVLCGVATLSSSYARNLISRKWHAQPAR